MYTPKASRATAAKISKYRSRFANSAGNISLRPAAGFFLARRLAAGGLDLWALLLFKASSLLIITVRISSNLLQFDCLKHA
jgi:hypothetical protein